MRLRCVNALERQDRGEEHDAEDRKEHDVAGALGMSAGGADEAGQRAADVGAYRTCAGARQVRDAKVAARPAWGTMRVPSAQFVKKKPVAMPMRLPPT